MGNTRSAFASQLLKPSVLLNPKRLARQSGRLLNHVIKTWPRNILRARESFGHLKIEAVKIRVGIVAKRAAPVPRKEAKVEQVEQRKRFAFYHDGIIKNIFRALLHFLEPVFQAIRDRADDATAVLFGV